MATLILKQIWRHMSRVPYPAWKKEIGERSVDDIEHSAQMSE